MSEPNQSEPNAFLRKQIAEATEEAAGMVPGVEPAPLSAEDEEALFEAHMRRFPGQHE
jgi:hypothetical protein